MNLIDVNVLIAMFDSGHTHHDMAMGWWREATSAGESFTVPDLVWVGFTRLVTSGRVLAPAATFGDAWAFAEAVTSQPTNLRFVADPRTLAEFAQQCRRTGARANLVTGAYIAACAAAYGATVVTFDRDFRRFDGLRVTELAS